MTKNILLSFSLCFLLLGCKLPTVGYLIVEPNIRAHQTESNANMTIVLEPSIKDSITIKSAGIKPMNIHNFRHTLEDAFKNTFKSSYTEVAVSNSFSQKGISLVFVKVTPDWNKKSSKTIVTGSGGNTNSRTAYELEAKLSYQAMVYIDGVKKGVIEGKTLSELSTFKDKETPDVLKDGITKMCEDIYKQTVKYN